MLRGGRSGEGREMGAQQLAERERERAMYILLKW